MKEVRIITNFFSTSMLKGETYLMFHPISKKELVDDLIVFHFNSAVDRADTAELLSNELGVKIIPNQISIQMDSRVVLYVAQYKEPGFSEGATESSEGRFSYWKVTV